MKNAVVIGCLCVLIGGAVLSYLVGFGFYLLPSGGGEIEDFDKLIARVADAAKSGHVAAGIANETCQASIPLHIDGLVPNFLDGKPMTPCSNALEPAAPLGKPLAVVDLDHKRFDSITRSLPAALLSPSLNAASTIVLTHCSKSEVGRYGYILTHTAYRQDCGLLIVSQSGSSEMQILGIQSFSALPPGKIDARFTFGDVVADRPEFQMQDYITYRSADAAKVQGR
jgi:hypothetical protein